VAILVAAGYNVRELSEWAGHNNVAFTLTRVRRPLRGRADEAVDRLDALLETRVSRSSKLVELREERFR
jgi:hypothetical protein